MQFGLGDNNAGFKVYIANTPDYSFSQMNAGLIALQKNDIYLCGQACGNGWRKVFNVYAKLVYALGYSSLISTDQQDIANNISSWQCYRDQWLLQQNSNTALLFNQPIFRGSAGNFPGCKQNNELHIIMGKTYAKSLLLPSTLVWINDDFAVDHDHKLVVCPYFDYRQLSNVKIVFLVDLIHSMFKDIALIGR